MSDYNMCKCLSQLYVGTQTFEKILKKMLDKEKIVLYNAEL